jgi:WD40 repeat protein/tetratricopeptide (TPR) repeat protein
VDGPLKHELAVRQVQFGEGGRWLLTATGAVQNTRPDRKAQVLLWDLKDRTALTLATYGARWIAQALLSPDGRRVAFVVRLPGYTARLNEFVQVMQLRATADGGRASVGAFRTPPRGGVEWIEFSPDGKRLLLAEDRLDATGRLSLDGVRVLDAATGSPAGPGLHHPGVLQASFSPDGEAIVTAGADRTARVWNARTGQVLAGPLVHQDLIELAFFTADGRRVVTASYDQTARVWDALTGEPVTPPLHHAERVQALALSADARRLVTHSADGTARLWDLVSADRPAVAIDHGTNVNGVAFLADGRHLAVSGWNGAGAYDAGSGKPVWYAHRPPQTAVRHRLARDRYLIRILTPTGPARHKPGSGEVTVWEAPAGKVVGTVRCDPDTVSHADVSPDGRRLAGCGSKGAWIWDLSSGKRLHALPTAGKPFARVVWSPDGRQLAGVGEGGVELWDADTGKPAGAPLPHPGHIQAVAFSADSKLLAVAGVGTGVRGLVRLWEVATGARVGPELEHALQVDDVAFSPSGRLLATCGLDRTARLWAVGTGKPVTPPMHHPAPVRRVVFSPLRKADATGGESESRFLGTVTAERLGDLRGSAGRVWEVATGEPLTPPLRHRRGATDLAFSPDARRVATAANDTTVRVWDLTPDSAPAEVLGELVVVLAGGRRLDPSFGLVRDAAVPDPRIGPAWERARGRHPATRPASTEEARAWEHQQAGAASARQRWYALAFHLSALIRRSPDEAGLYERRAVAHAYLGERAKAVADCTRAIDLGRDGGQVRANRGRLYLELGRWQEAHDDFDRAFKDRPADWAVWYGRGVALARLGQAGRALKDLDRALVHDGTRWEAWLEKGRVLLEGERNAEALEALTAARKLVADSWEVCLARGAALRRLGQHARAVAELTRALELNAGTAEGWYERGHALLGLGRWEQAVSDFSRALERNARLSEAALGRARAASELGRWQEAARDWERVRRDGKGSPESVESLGLVRLQLGDARAFPAACARLIEQATASDNPRQTEHVARVCSTPGSGADPALVLKLAQKAARARPKDAICQLTLAVARYRAGETKQALAALQGLHKAERGAPPAEELLWLALMLHGAGQADEGRSRLAEAVRALELAPPEPPAGPDWRTRVRVQLLRAEAERVLAR